MSDPALELQKAIVKAVQGDAALLTLIGTRIHDRVPNPATATFPYVTVGDDQTNSDAAECLMGSVELFTTLHVWSRKNNKAEAKTIAGSLFALLNAAEQDSPVPLTLEGYRLVLIEHQTTRYLDDPDGMTVHAPVTFRALLDEI